MQIAQLATAPIVMAEMRYILSVHPRMTKIIQVMSRVVMVIPETGLELEPTRPTVMDVTATKKNPSTTSNTTVNKFMGSVGNSHKKRIMAKDPRISQAREMSFSVLGRCLLSLKPPTSSLILTWMVLKRRGKILIRLNRPPM